MKKIMSMTLSIIVCVVSLNSVIVKGEENVLSKQPETGDYISFGTYNGDKIVWQVIGKDYYGDSLLWSENIVDYLAFDGSESGLVNQGTTEADKYGSNVFSNSNIKEWLNSNEKIVSYSTTKPTNDAVIEYVSFDDSLLASGYNYKEGFLYAFSSNELEALKSYDYTTKEVSNDYEDNYSFSIGTIKDAMNQYSQGRQVNDSSKVFLLSLEELSRFVTSNGLSIGKSVRNSNAMNFYWLRTPDGKGQKSVMTIDYVGNAYKTDSNFSYTGVVPAILVDLEQNPAFSGTGIEKDPYVLDLKYTDNLLISLSLKEKNEYLALVQEYKNEFEKSKSTFEKEKIVRNIEDRIMESLNPSEEKAIIKHYLEQAGVRLYRGLYNKEHLLTSTFDGTSLEFSDLDNLMKTEVTAIKKLVDYGIINGYQDGTYRPLEPVTRSEIAKIITLTIQAKNVKSTAYFHDVAKDKWYADYVEGIKNEGLIIGYPDGNFGPLNTITFDEMGTIIQRILINKNEFYPVSGKDIEETLLEDSFVGFWAKDNISLLLQHGLIDSSIVYDGNRTINRLEVAVIIEKLMRLIY